MARLFLLFPLLGLAACSSGSTTLEPGCGLAMPSLAVSVVNDSNEILYLCTATVVAKGPSTLTLMPTGGTMCGYQGPVTTGTYDVTATLSGYTIPPIHVTVQQGCNAVGSLEATPSM
jgi:hypothetical protein